jgi:hypothetical protein
VAGSNRFRLDRADSGCGGERGGEEFFRDAPGRDDPIAARDQPRDGAEDAEGEGFGRTTLGAVAADKRRAQNRERRKIQGGEVALGFPLGAQVKRGRGGVGADG